MKNFVINTVVGFMLIVLFQITFGLIGTIMCAPTSSIFFMAGVCFVWVYDFYEKSVESGNGYLKSLVKLSVLYIAYTALFSIITFSVVVFNGGDIDFSKGYDKLNQEYSFHIKVNEGK